jgi:hypothetical protein
MVNASPVSPSIDQIIFGIAGILLAAAIIVILIGVFMLRRAPRQPFFLARQQTAAAGWRLLLVASFILLLAGLVRWTGTPVALQIITPTPSLTFTPSITYTPSITQIPTDTFTPTITFTPSRTSIPSATGIPTLPAAVLRDFTSNVIPSPEIRIAPLVFTTTYTSDLQPLQKSKVFFNPVQRVAGIFSYQGINLGVQFTALWLRNGELVFWKTEPWNQEPNGTGLTQWNLTPDVFQPGAYEVLIYIGTKWYISGQFDIVGPVPTATTSPTPSDTRLPVILTPTQTQIPTVLRSPTLGG